MIALSRVERVGAAALALVACLVVGACESRAPRRAAKIPPPVSDETLAIADTASAWVAAPRPAPDSTSLRLTVLWDATDPVCIAMMPVVEAWHEAYDRFGLRVIATHFARASRLADTSTVASAARRLGLRFAIAASGEPLPAALAAGRGPVLVLRDRAATPQWLADANEARRFESRLRAALRSRHPEMRFPSDAGAAPVGEANGALHWRTVALAAGAVARGPLARAVRDATQPFTTQFRFQEEGAEGVPVPIGWWTPRRDGLEAARGGAANMLAIRYDAGRVGLVMAPPASGAARVWVLQDERWIAAGDAGEDVQYDSRGAAFVLVTEPRLYWIARGGRHVLKLSPDVAGVWVYDYQFEVAEARP